MPALSATELTEPLLEFQPIATRFTLPAVCAPANVTGTDVWFVCGVAATTCTNASGGVVVVVVVVTGVVVDGGTVLVLGNAPDGLSSAPTARDSAKSDLRDIYRVFSGAAVVSGTATDIYLAVAPPWVTVSYNLPHLAVKGMIRLVEAWTAPRRQGGNVALGLARQPETTRGGYFDGAWNSAWNSGLRSVRPV